MYFSLLSDLVVLHSVYKCIYVCIVVLTYYNNNDRASEVSKVELAEKQQNDSSECKDVAVIPQQSLQKQ